MTLPSRTPAKNNSLLFSLDLCLKASKLGSLWSRNKNLFREFPEIHILPYESSLEDHSIMAIPGSHLFG